jgi:hypothetical protein
MIWPAKPVAALGDDFYICCLHRTPTIRDEFRLQVEGNMQYEMRRSLQSIVGIE